VQCWLELKTRDDERLAPWAGVHDKPCGAAPAPFSPSPAADEAEEACPDLAWVQNAVKRRGDGEFCALGFEQQGLETGSLGVLFIGQKS
jgi:hypothetical protein